MATTVYTNWSNEVSVSSSSTRKYRGFLTYTVTTSNTTVTITAYSGIQQSGAMSVAYTDTQAATGQTSKTGTYSFSYSTGETTHTLVSTQTYTYERTTSTYSRNIAISVHATNATSASGWNTTTLSKTVTLSIPAKPSYTVSYNANGGSGSLANQTKWYNTALTLYSSGFSKTGYTLVSWNTNSAGTGTTYNKGASYTSNAALALYAIWTPNTYTVQFNSNDGTSRTDTQTYTYDVEQNLKTISTIGWSRDDYLFAGWATSPNGAVVYQEQTIDNTTVGALVKNLATSGTFNLYAIWKYQFISPDITTITAYRGNVGSTNIFTPDDTGTAGRIIAMIEPGYKYLNIDGTGQNVNTQIIASYRLANTSDAYVQIGNIETINDSSSLEWITGNNIFDPARQYEIKVVAQVVEQVGGSDVVKISTTNTTYISVAEFTIDFDENGESIGIFGVAEGKTSSGEKIVWLNGDIVFAIDNHAASGTDYEIYTALLNLGWDVNPT